MVFVTSGAGSLTHPGNVLLAFDVPETGAPPHLAARRSGEHHTPR
jgi:hypothetical protein